LTLSSTANTFSGKITVTTGMLEFSAESNLGTATGADAITLDNSCTGVNFYYLRCTGTISLNVNRGITLGSSGGAIGASSGKTLTVNGPITGTGALWASPTGGAAIGQVTLANTGNNYSGGTYITAGTLNLGADNTLPSGKPLTIAASSGTDWFNMQGHNQTIGTLTSSTSATYGTGTPGTPNLQLSTSGSPANTLTIIQTANTAFNGIITGTGGGITLDATSTSTLSLGGGQYLHRPYRRQWRHA
jgi:fibronectin-binding autotransporter adhesin